MKPSLSKAFTSRFSISQKHHKKEVVPTRQEKILNLEEKQICNQLGIDQSEITKYKWLFEQIRYTQLPARFIRVLEGDQDSGKVKYLDMETKAEFSSSPLLGLFKKTLYEKVGHAKAAYGFDDKARKLLPFMEEKLARERIGLASKRKEAERVNLVRDQKGKVTTSKTVRIVPDTKKMLISRDYLLKMIVDKVITKGELYGRGKRARQYSILLDRFKKQRESKEQLLKLSDLSIDDIEIVYEQATEFYLYTIGTLEQIPIFIEESRSYRNLTPNIVARCLTTLGVQKQRIEEYWFGKIMSCLPLPPGWVEKKSISEESDYFYEPKNLVVSIHPSINYIAHQINEFRNKFSEMEENEKLPYYQNRQMTFIDFFDRPYKVDMFLILSKREEKHEEDHEVYAEKIINDWLIVEGVEIADLRPEHYHLSEAVEDYFVESLDGTELWYPQVSPYGQIIWTNTITTLCTEKCPIEKEIKEQIRLAIDDVPEIEMKNYSQLFNFIQNNHFIKEVYQRAVSQRKRLLESYIQKEQFQWGRQFDDMEELIFCCPFDFVSEIEGCLPSWLEKSLAKTYNKIIKIALHFASTSDELNAVQHLISSYFNILKQNPNWESYFRQTLSSIQTNNKINLENIVKTIFDYEERMRWLKFQNKNDHHKAAEESKAKYYEAHKHLFKEPVVIPEKVEEESEKNEEEIKSKSNQPTTVSTKKYFNYDSQYDYDKANRLINVIQQWDQADLKEEDSEQKQKKRYAKDTDMILITNEEELDGQLRELKKKINRTKKFTSARQQTKLLQKVNSTSNDYDRIIYKNGLLKSKLKNETAAMNKKSREKFLRKEGVQKSRAQTSLLSHQSPSINMFNSICSHYTNTSIVKMVQKERQEQIAKNEKEEEEQIFIPTKTEYKRENIFQLPSEYPSILPLLKKKDLNFVHMSEAKTTDFKGVFTREKSQSTIPSTKHGDKSLHRYNKSTENLKSQSKATNQHVRSQSKIEKTNPNPQMTKIRCLDSTCSHLLNSDVVTSKLVFDRLEIRKELFLKNRGIKLIHL